jgi:hypothetical protein
MKYKSTCSICLRETETTDNICEMWHIKSKAGFIEIDVHCDYKFYRLNFCPSCAKKPITVEKLMTISNYTGWSY